MVVSFIEDKGSDRNMYESTETISLIYVSWYTLLNRTQKEYWLSFYCVKLYVQYKSGHFQSQYF